MPQYRILLTLTHDNPADATPDDIEELVAEWLTTLGPNPIGASVDLDDVERMDESDTW